MQKLKLDMTILKIAIVAMILAPALGVIAMRIAPEPVVLPDELELLDVTQTTPTAVPTPEATLPPLTARHETATGWTLNTQREITVEPPEEHIDAIVEVLTAECYDFDNHGKRGVVTVILNRVTAGIYGDGVIGVIDYPNAFHRYAARPATDEDYAIAYEIYQQWIDADCDYIGHNEYNNGSAFFFDNADSDFYNEFREEY